MSIIQYILNGELRTKESTKNTFLYSSAQIRKLAVNIDGDLPNTNFTKIVVTEKSYDFVTFLHNNILFAECQIYSKSSIRQIQHNLQMSVFDILQKRNSKTENHTISEFL